MSNVLFPLVKRRKTESGYEIEYRHYRSESCEECPLKPECTKAQGNREVKISMKYWRLKNNRGFKKFLLRGLPKVSLEVGWLSLAHNLLKKAAIDAKSKGVKH